MFPRRLHATTDHRKWPLKPEILTSLELWHIASKFQLQVWSFWPWRARKKRVDKWFRQLSTARNANSGAKTAILLFCVVYRRRNRLSTLHLHSSSPWSKTPDLSLKIRCFSSYLQNYYYFWLASVLLFPFVHRILFVNTFCELQVVENFAFATRKK